MKSCRWAAEGSSCHSAKALPRDKLSTHLCIHTYPAWLSVPPFFEYWDVIHFRNPGGQDSGLFPFSLSGRVFPLKLVVKPAGASRNLEREAEDMHFMPSKPLCPSQQQGLKLGGQGTADHFPTGAGQRAWQDASDSLPPPARQMQEALAAFPTPPHQG